MKHPKCPKCGLRLETDFCANCRMIELDEQLSPHMDDPRDDEDSYSMFEEELKEEQDIEAFWDIVHNQY